MELERQRMAELRSGELRGLVQSRRTRMAGQAAVAVVVLTFATLALPPLILP